MHFTRLGDLDPGRLPVIVRGDGCHVFDERGRRYLDGLAALFCVNAGHGRRELADAARDQAAELAFFQTWGFAHPPAAELAERVARLAPSGLDRVFFTSGGSEAVETALKLARAYHRRRGETGRVKVVARQGAYHGTSLGALSATGLEGIRRDFEPLVPGACHVPNTASPPPAGTADPLWSAAAIEERIVEEGPETVAAVILEPVQNAGGCLVPPDGYFARVREICDRHGVLLISDEVICAWGRLGHWFGCERYGYLPDLVTTAKGLTSAYAPMGAVVISDRVAEPFVAGDATFAHGFTFGGHPVAAAVALRNLRILEDERLCEHVRANEGRFRQSLESLRSLPVVGEVRGAGYFYAIELVRDRDAGIPFAPEEHAGLLRDLPRALMDAGLICRVDDRGGRPVVQLCPPLVAGPDEFAEIHGALSSCLADLVP
jgi:adenosylmethionine-8-amino-7-oxononanoate aminotransferase